ncbi:MAG: hypothetical protein IIC83_09980 [Chloroflexi bacterium]|nr:hypothetical protein [Chloroflexota bacterium]
MTSTETKSILNPKEFLGFEVGQDRKLAGWPQVLEYFKLLDGASDRLQSRVIGESTEGNPFLMVTISSPENLARLEQHRSIQDRLADPRTISSDAEAERLIADGKTIVAISCSIHATEVGATQMSLLLGHHLATSDDERVKRILDNVILLLLPSLNPDGLISVKEWYDASVGTSYEGAMPPFLYQKYTGHDNNRDWFMFTQVETRLVVEHCLNAWHPQILYDLHQTRSTGMRMILPPFVDPVGPNVDPILQGELSMLGSAVASELTAEGKAGVAVNVVYDAYSPNRTYSHYHGGIRLLSEVAGVRIATPVEVHPGQMKPSRGEYPARKSWNHPLPWKGGRWSLRDIVDYDFSAVMACLDNGARYRDQWLRNFYRVGKRATSVPGNPSAFLIPQVQRDPVASHELMTVLQTAQVEIHQATEVFEADGQAYPPGTMAVLTMQPYGSFAKTLLEVQKYPDLRTHADGPPRTPYDVTTHNLPLQMGVNAIEIKAPFNAELKRVSRLEPAAGAINPAKGGSTTAYLLRPESNAGARAVNRLLSLGAEVRWAREPFRAADKHYPQGTFVVEAASGKADAIGKIASETMQRFDAVSDMPDFPSYTLTRPRVGLYKSFVPSAEEGWTRYVLEEYEFGYTSLGNQEIQDGSLHEKFDAVVLPHQWTRQIHHGHGSGNYHPDYCGGIGDGGAEKLREFVEKGGTLIAWDGAARWAIQHLELSVKNCLSGLPHAEFYAPGSLLSVLLDSKHPIAYGMPDPAAAMFVNGPAFETKEGRVVGKFPLRSPLLSGLLIGPQHLYGKAAIVTVPLSKGEVILIGFRPNFRAQARGTYKILFNSLYYGAARRSADE